MIDRAQVVSALATILDAIEEHDANRRDCNSPIQATPFKWVNFKDIPRREDAFGEYAADPVGTALRYAIKDIGRRAGKVFTGDELAAIADEAASKCGRWGYRMDVLDKRFDGITTSEGQIWAA